MGEHTIQCHLHGLTESCMLNESCEFTDVSLDAKRSDTSIVKYVNWEGVLSITERSNRCSTEGFALIHN